MRCRIHCMLGHLISSVFFNHGTISSVIRSRLGRPLILSSNYLPRHSTLSPCHPTITFLPPTYSILDIHLRQPTRARSSHRQRARCTMRSQRRTYSICAEPPTIVTFSFREGPAHALLLVLRISVVGHKVGHCSPTLIRASCSAMENSSKSTGAYRPQPPLSAEDLNKLSTLKHLSYYLAFYLVTVEAKKTSRRARASPSPPRESTTMAILNASRVLPSYQGNIFTTFSLAAGLELLLQMTVPPRHSSKISMTEPRL